MNVLFYGNMPQEKDGHITGAQIGNVKTLEILKKKYKVRILKRIYRIKFPFVDYFHYICGLFVLFVKEVFLLSDKDIKVFHVSGFYMQQIYIEFVLVHFAKIFNKKVVYEMRAGGAIDAYNKGSSLYKYLFREVLKKSSCVLVQGFVYKKFIESIESVYCIYYPNFIRRMWLEKAVHNVDLKEDDVIKLVYWGRISEDKNIDLIIKVVAYLQAKKYNVTLDLYGRIYCEKYGAYIYDTILSENVLNCVLHEAIYEEEKLINSVFDKHFYVFPSNNKREGHSNSLTEAMALGIVPVCSDDGFNASVVGNRDLIATNYTFSEYGEIIIKIIKENKYEYYRAYIINRVKNNFVENIVGDNLLCAYKKIIYGEEVAP